ncbi:nuclear transport factor 2 family protein [Fodinicola acaciae]|uniref:nuclear transport factor 2 family protein n=1 Tax=Fodinicola acaciae TaxID=2681555 RepID=UPI0013D57B04|nr:nuclear transport factor 2 family protein [Fodinicola acaciae]
MNDGAVLTRLLHAIDSVDWPTVRACFTDKVHIDYTSLFGGEPETLAADELVERWRGLLPGFDATQHLTGPVLVDADGRLDTHVRSFHVLDGDIWAVHGHYSGQLRDGRIASLTLTLFYQEGNRSLPVTAGERAKTSPRR